MADVQLDYPVHYLRQPTKYDPGSGLSADDGPPVPYCGSKSPGILTKNQSRVDCQRCISSAGIKGKNP